MLATGALEVPRECGAASAQELGDPSRLTRGFPPAIVSMY